MPKKKLTLREKIITIVIQFCNAAISGKELDIRIMHLIRYEQKRKCEECLRVKNLIDKQIEKNRGSDAEAHVRPSCYSK
jgi:hypothetical protein